MNIWTGLLFLDGAIADVELARDLAGISAPAAAAEVVAAEDEPRDARGVRHSLSTSHRPEETTMNLFKGLLYLLDNDRPASPKLIEAPHYGAASAAQEFAEDLGNRAASARWFGEAREHDPALDPRGVAVGGCR